MFNSRHTESTNKKPSGDGAIRRSHFPLRSALEPAISFEFNHARQLATESFRFRLDKPSSLIVLEGNSPAVSAHYRARIRVAAGRRLVTDNKFTRPPTRGPNEPRSLLSSDEYIEPAADQTVARRLWALVVDAFAPSSEFTLAVWYGSRTRDSQSNGLVLYPLS
jgi:hypothetical protein